MKYGSSWKGVEVHAVLTADLLGNETSPRPQHPIDFPGIEAGMAVDHQIQRGIVKGHLFAGIRNLDHLCAERG